jgi:tetratricopeptide (TPR) repeat protein
MEINRIELHFSIKKFLLLAAVLCIVVYVFFFSSSMYGLLNPILLTLLSICLIIFPGKTRLRLTIPAFFFLAVLSATSLHSIDPRRSFSEISQLAIGFLIIFAVADLISHGMPDILLVDSLLIVGSILMIPSWIIVFSQYQNWLTVSPGEWIPGISYRLYNGNFIAAYCSILLMLALSRLMRTGNITSKILIILFCLSNLGLIYLSSSRGTWVGILVSLVFIALIQRRCLFDLWSRLNRIKKYFILCLLASGTILVAFMIWFYFTNLAINPTHGSGTNRAAYWAPAWQAFLKSPWFGNGFGTFASFFMQSKSTPPSNIFLHAHNTYLDILSGGGIVGFLAFIGLLIGFVLTFRKSVQNYNGNNQAILIGTAAALVTFLAQSLFAAVYRMSFASLSLCLALGAAFGKQKLQDSQRSFYVSSFGVVIAILAWVNLWQVTPLAKGVQAANKGDYQAAAGFFQEAVRRDSTLVITHQQFGLAESMLSAQGDEDALQLAIHAFERVVQLDPYWSMNHANLGALYMDAGNLDAAAKEFEEAYNLAPDWGLYTLNLGVAEEARGNPIKARDAYIRSLSLEPSWSTDDFWQASPLRKDVLASVKLASPEENSRSVRLTKEQVLHQAYAAPIIILANQEIELGRLDEADKLLKVSDMAFFRGFQDRLELSWSQASLLAAYGNYQEASQRGQKVLSDFQSKGVYGQQSGFGKSLYADGVFHVPSMDFELVPQLTVIHLPTPWDERMAQLANWYSRAGDVVTSQAIYTKLAQLRSDIGQLDAIDTPKSN